MHYYDKLGFTAEILSDSFADLREYLLLLHFFK